jgi:hypothetical protein
MSLHFKYVCAYGYVHSQCRCMSPNKVARPIECYLREHQTNPTMESRPDVINRAAHAAAEVEKYLSEHWDTWGETDPLEDRDNLWAIVKRWYA